MSFANDVAFSADADVLLRYGVLRQQAEAHQQVFCDGRAQSCLQLPAICKPGVLTSLRAALPGLTAQPVVAAQRNNPWLNQLIWELTSGTFIRGLEASTGFQHMLPDAGFHQGGWLDQASATSPIQKHPRWNLPAVLVLDMCLACDATDNLKVTIGDVEISLAAEDSLLWQVTDAGVSPVWPVSAHVLRLVYYQGADDA